MPTTASDTKLSTVIKLSQKSNAVHSNLIITKLKGSFNYFIISIITANSSACLVGPTTISMQWRKPLRGPLLGYTTTHAMKIELKTNTLLAQWTHFLFYCPLDIAGKKSAMPLCFGHHEQKTPFPVVPTALMPFSPSPWAPNKRHRRSITLIVRV